MYIRHTSWTTTCILMGIISYLRIPTKKFLVLLMPFWGDPFVCFVTTWTPWEKNYWSDKLFCQIAFWRIFRWVPSTVWGIAATHTLCFTTRCLVIKMSKHARDNRCHFFVCFLHSTLSVFHDTKKGGSEYFVRKKMQALQNNIVLSDWCSFLTALVLKLWQY